MAELDKKQSVLKELDRLLATPPFASATRSAALLRFLVTETLAERSDRLKEYVLGVEALGKPESFDPRIDPIARVEASRLRNKLELSYANGDGPSDVRIMLPRARTFRNSNRWSRRPQPAGVVWVPRLWQPVSSARFSWEQSRLQFGTAETCHSEP